MSLFSTKGSASSAITRSLLLGASLAVMSHSENGDALKLSLLPISDSQSVLAAEMQRLHAENQRKRERLELKRERLEQKRSDRKSLLAPIVHMQWNILAKGLHNDLDFVGLLNVDESQDVAFIGHKFKKYLENDFPPMKTLFSGAREFKEKDIIELLNPLMTIVVDTLYGGSQLGDEIGDLFVKKEVSGHFVDDHTQVIESPPFDTYRNKITSPELKLNIRRDREGSEDEITYTYDKLFEFLTEYKIDGLEQTNAKIAESKLNEDLEKLIERKCERYSKDSMEAIKNALLNKNNNGESSSRVVAKNLFNILNWWYTNVTRELHRKLISYRKQFSSRAQYRDATIFKIMFNKSTLVDGSKNGLGLYSLDKKTTPNLFTLQEVELTQFEYFLDGVYTSRSGKKEDFTKQGWIPNLDVSAWKTFKTQLDLRSLAEKQKIAEINAFLRKKKVPYQVKKTGPAIEGPLIMIDPSKFELVNSHVVYLEYSDKVFGIIAKAVNRLDGKFFRIVSYHLSSGMGDTNQKKRREQLSIMKNNLDKLATYDGDEKIPVIMSGDMNADMEAEDEKTMKNFMTTELVATNFSATPEFENYGNIRLDSDKRELLTLGLKDALDSAQLISDTKLSDEEKANIKIALQNEIKRLDNSNSLNLRPATTGKLRVLSAQPEKIGTPLAHAIDSVAHIGTIQKRINKSNLFLYPAWIMNMLNEKSSVPLFFELNAIYKKVYKSLELDAEWAVLLPPGFRPRHGIILLPRDATCPSDHVPVVTEFVF
jgi:hypothetical protein